MYLFDTDCISNLLKKNPSKRVIENIAKLEKSEQYVSTITVGELVFGAFKSNNTQLLLDKITNMLLPSINILDFNSSAAFIYGKIRAELEKNGEVISNPDIQIASIAIANNLTVITGNTRHFGRIKELKIENWLN
ncbi:MAG: PIN domain-containing protein [Actinobacteria bacterium]|nr:PIN domain-containing protein [Actinomycetota bacterium]